MVDLVRFVLPALRQLWWQSFRSSRAWVACARVAVHGGLHAQQTGNHKGLTFGIFLAPFHRVGENPTLAMARDMELIEWIDELGFDEAWIGEHHLCRLGNHRLAGSVHRRRHRAHALHPPGFGRDQLCPITTR